MPDVTNTYARGIPTAADLAQLYEVYRLAEESSPTAVREALKALPADLRDVVRDGLVNSSNRTVSQDKSLSQLMKNIQQIAFRAFDALPAKQKQNIEVRVCQKENLAPHHSKDHVQALLQCMAEEQKIEEDEVGEILNKWVLAGERGENRKEAANRIANFIKSPGNSGLDLRNLRLKSVPAVFHCSVFSSRLIRLDLGDNSLTRLPEEIEQLSALEELDLSSNELTTFPNRLCHLHSLKELNLFGNQITVLPNEINKLKNLRSLDLTRTGLTAWPKELRGLPALRELVLSENEISIFPVEISLMETLEILVLSGNRLTDFPKELLVLKGLKKLDISYNYLTSLPEEISRLSALEEFSLSSNHCTSLPEGICQLQALKKLDLYKNSLTTLPAGIRQLVSLESLDLSYNEELVGLPGEICELPSSCEVDLEGSGLSETVLDRLRTAVEAEGYAGPTISFSMPDRGSFEEGRSTEESLQDLFDKAERTPREFAILKQGSAKTKETMRSWLARIAWMKDYKSGGELQKVLASKVIDYLELAEKSPHFWERFLPIIDGAAATCGDRVALSVLHLGIAYTQESIDLKKLRVLADFLIKGPWALEQLEEMARQKISRLKFFDEVEVYLGYPVMLKERLGLVIDVQEMLFFRCSALTEGDLQIAEQFISTQLQTEDALPTILIQYDLWKEALKHHYPKEMQNIEVEKEKSQQDEKSYAEYEKRLISLSRQALASSA